MKVVVLVKQVPDSEANIRINSANTGIETSGIKLVMNPYDEYAMEEALKIKEKNADVEITALTLGQTSAQEVLRSCLALGAQKAVIVKLDNEAPDNYASAYILSKALEKIGFDLILAGKQAIDDGAGFTPGAISSMLNIPFVSSAIKLELDMQNKNCIVSREIEGSTEVVECSYPAVISAEKGLNQPRFASLMGIMQAKKKSIEEVSLSDLEINTDDIKSLNKTKLEKLEYPPQRKQGEILQGEAAEAAAKLVEKLKEAKIL